MVSIRDFVFREIYKLKLARLQAFLCSHRREQGLFSARRSFWKIVKQSSTTTQVKYVEMFMDLVSFGVDFGMVGVAHDYVLWMSETFQWDAKAKILHWLEPFIRYGQI